MLNFFNKTSNFNTMRDSYSNKQAKLEDTISYISNSQDMWDFIKMFTKSPELMRVSYIDKLEQYFKILDMKEFYEYLKIAFVFCKQSELLRLLKVLTDKSESLYHIKITQSFFITHQSKMDKDFCLFITKIPKQLIPLLKPYLSLFNVTQKDIQNLVYLPEYSSYSKELHSLINILSDTTHTLYANSGNGKLYNKMNLNELWSIQKTTDNEWQNNLLRLLEQAIITNQDITVYWKEINNLNNKELRDQCMLILLNHKPEIFIHESYFMSNDNFWKCFLSNDSMQKQSFVLLNSFWHDSKMWNYQSLLESNLEWRDKQYVFVQMIVQFINITWYDIQKTLLINLSMENIIGILDVLDKHNKLDNLVSNQDIDDSLFVNLTLHNRTYICKFLTKEQISRKALTILIEGTDSKINYL